jgi:hypothetical protein
MEIINPTPQPSNLVDILAALLAGTPQPGDVLEDPRIGVTFEVFEGLLRISAGPASREMPYPIAQQ